MYLEIICREFKLNLVVKLYPDPKLLVGWWNEIGRAVKIRPQIGNVTAINYLYNCAADYPDPTYGEFARIPQPNSLLNLLNFNCD